MVITGKNATVRVDTAPTRMIVSTRMEPVLMDVNSATEASHAKKVGISTNQIVHF